MTNRTQEEIMQNWGADNCDTPLVSVRCITYNHEPYIAQALDGFLMQRTDFPFEVIVHDDASTDRTAEIIREYEARFPKIIKPIYETENQYSKHDGSLGRIMDAACKGKYIAFCEGDDYWIDENKLQMQADFLEGNPEYSAYYSNIDGIDEQGKAFYYPYKVYPLYPNHIVSQSCPLYFSPVGQTATCMIRACILSKYPKHPLLANGDVIISCLARASGNVFYSVKQLARHRKTFSGDSWTARTHNKDMSLYYYRAHMEVLEWSKNELGKSYSDETVFLFRFILKKMKMLLKKPSLKNLMETFEMLRLCMFKTLIFSLFINRKKNDRLIGENTWQYRYNGGGYNLRPYASRPSCGYWSASESSVRRVA